MVQHHRPYCHHQPRKGDEEQPLQQQQGHQSPRACCEYYWGGVRKARPRLLRLLLVFGLVSCGLLFGARLLFGAAPSSFLFSLYSFGVIDQEEATALPSSGPNSRVPCFSVPGNSICCDRTSSNRTDVCVLRGDVRTRSSASAIFLYSASSSSSSAAASPYLSPSSRGKKQSNHSSPAPLVEKIRPYTRKWEKPIMDTVDELALVAHRDAPGAATHKCDVVHGVPAVVFSTGGYTGNVYHEFNDGIIPLYLTSRHLHRRVVFVMQEYHSWWVTKYGDILSRLSAYPPVDFSGDKRTHCFPEATVGLRIHGELTVDAALARGNESILDFRQVLDDAYRPRIRSLEQEEQQQEQKNATAAEAAQELDKARAPKLVIISRNGSRGIENEQELVELCEEIGFQVEVLRPDRTTELAKIYRALNSSDAMVGVHGAAMTHLLFMRPGSVFIQVVPLGTEWAAQTYYGDPALRLGLKYVAYKVLPRESSLYAQYAKDDPVLTDPTSVTSQGWEMTKKVYLDGQTVRLDLNRFLKRLTRAYQYIVARKMADASLSWNENWLPRRQRERRQQQRRLGRR